jgi:FkbM family methyltransferase
MLTFGILRSLLIYYGQPHKLLRLVRFYRPFIHPGDLCFDLGAHVGNRLWAYLRLGARVVAVEPQPALARLLRRLYGDNPRVELVEKAAGAASGQATLQISPRTPTVSSLSSAWISRVGQTASFRGVTWDASFPVSVTTLDELIQSYGEPAYCKIDVEGFEHEVLLGLSRPLALISFEYLPAAPDLALACLERLAALGEYEYNWSERETHRLRGPSWLTPTQAATFIRSLPLQAPSGDIYARRSAAG